MATTKVKQPYLKYDSIVIGPNAKSMDSGFFNDWVTFARSSTLRWFTDRSSSVPNWASSSNTDRTDWAFEAHQAGIEFWAPKVVRNQNTEVTDIWMPETFTVDLPTMMSFDFKLADTDVVLKLPGVHAPAGVGSSGLFYDNSPSPTVIPAINGVPMIANSWKFPDPLKISMRTTITVESRVEEPLTGLLTNAAGPGFKVYPVNMAGASYDLPNFYVIRVWLRGARYIDNIGARG